MPASTSGAFGRGLPARGDLARMDFADHRLHEAMRRHPPVPHCGLVTQPGCAPRLAWVPLPWAADGVPLELAPPSAASSADAAPAPAFEWHCQTMKARIDLSDKQALLDAMNERRP